MKVNTQLLRVCGLHLHCHRVVGGGTADQPSSADVKDGFIQISSSFYRLFFQELRTNFCSNTNRDIDYVNMNEFVTLDK